MKVADSRAVGSKSQRRRGLGEGDPHVRAQPVRTRLDKIFFLFALNLRESDDSRGAESGLPAIFVDQSAAIPTAFSPSTAILRS
jgi:hypothetical protein